MATPRHPFFHWLLEDRQSVFHKNPHAFPKGPFSYSIEKDIDRYYEFKQQKKEAVGAAGAVVQKGIIETEGAADDADDDDNDVIIELSEDVLHPLVDATNSRLFSQCININSKNVKNNSNNANSNTVQPPDVQQQQQQQQKQQQAVEELKQGEVSYSSAKESVCQNMMHKKYLQASKKTVMVHTWTHVYLGERFSFAYYYSFLLLIRFVLLTYY